MRAGCLTGPPVLIELINQPDSTIPHLTGPVAKYLTHYLTHQPSLWITCVFPVMLLWITLYRLWTSLVLADSVWLLP